MPKPNTIVSGIQRLDPPVDRPFLELPDVFAAPLSVYFNNRETAQLDNADPQFAAYAEILSDLQQQQLPVYVEVNPADRKITALEIPVPGTVAALSSGPSGEITFRLDQAARPFTFNRGNAEFRTWLRVLRRAQRDGTAILVTETEFDPEIVDIRPAENPPAPALLLPAAVAPARRSAVTRPVTPERAAALFEIVAARSCLPAALTAPCIPFLYLRDGCHARAHEMCRLIRQEGEEPAKVWNFSNELLVKTPIEPNCQAIWGFHVAPTIEVLAPGDVEPQVRVIDPSLFDGPVPVVTWQNAQGDPDSILAFTSSDPFLPLKSGDVETDPTNSETIQALTVYRSKLKRRWAKLGPPPYRKCPGAGDRERVVMRT